MVAAAAPAPRPSQPPAQPPAQSGFFARIAQLRSRPWWPWAKRVGTVAFFCLIGWLLAEQAQAVQWHAVWAAMRDTPGRYLLAAVATAAASHLLYSTYDLLGRHYTGHTLSAPTVMTVTFISYAFNLNLGSLVGGVAFRYRLYARLGLEPGTTTRILTLSMLTNWLGYLVLAGGVFLAGAIDVPDGWKLGTAAMRLLGAGLLAVALAYLVACAVMRGRSLSLRGHAFTMPSLPVALLQLAVSCTNWLLIACTVYWLLGQRVEFPLVLGALLAAAVAGVVTHVPAGLGVLEAVFIALLGGIVPRDELLGALLVYRAIYYLAPLLLATATYLVTESRAKRLAAGQPPQSPTSAQTDS